MQAFGPFAEKAEVDFTALADAGLFLIHGPTGAGKTSVLDALCYALYGTASGSGRDARHMRSHHAALDLPTEVSLIFALGNEIYEVRRRPEQQRPSRRGAGLVTERPRAALWRLHGSPPGAPGMTPPREDETRELLVEGVREVTGEITSLLGFDAAQFRQVVMLPQGEFRRFIEAGVRERQDILRRLFDTRECQELEIALRERAADVSGQLDDLRRRVDDILGRHRVADQAALAERAESLRQATGAAGRQAERLGAGLSRIDSLVESVQRLRHAMEEAGRAEKACDLAREELESSRQARETAEERLRELQARARERKAWEQELEERRRQLERASDLRRLEDAIAETARALREEDGRRKALEDSLAARRAALEEARQAGEALSALRAELRDVAARREHLRAAAERVEALAELLREQAGAARDHACRERNVSDGERKVQALRQRLEELRARWRQARAADLARDLAPGRPCPVCGSRSHPAPATPGDSAAPPDPREEERLLAALERAEAELAKARAAQGEAAVRLARLEEAIRQRLDDLRERLAEERIDMPADPTPEALKAIRDELLRAGRQAAETLSALERREGELEKKAARLQRLQEEIASLEKHLRESEQEQAALGRREAELRGRLAVLRQALPPQLLDVSRLKEEIARLEESITAHDRSLEHATREHEERARAHAAARGRLEAALARLQEAKAAQETASVALAAALSGADPAEIIPLPEALPPIAEPNGARKDEAPPEQREETPDEAALRLRTLRNRLGQILETLRKAASGEEPPDAAALTALREALAAERNRWQLRQGELRRELQHVQGDLSALAEAAAAGEALAERAGLLRHLADLAAGRATDRRISFERFVLGMLFEEVLGAANIRLARMTRGRYRFELPAGEAAAGRDRRLLGGLEMVVRDAFTGSTRPVQTLSGGESFLAALSLALGLADVARRHAGGRHLETLFIDEGFGSLDPEALDLALNALTDLRQDGRLIGIISHVAELRERIPVRLAVAPCQRGSRLRLEV
jgi:exonuclease SbcC